MQTFLPYPDFADSARVLDRMRLGKQRVETYQVMKVLCGLTTGGWVNHPAVRMWRGYEAKLLEYQTAVCRVWLSLGYKDTCWDKTHDTWLAGGRPGIETEEVYSAGRLVARVDTGVTSPPWLGREDLHASHRGNLVRKDPLYYGPLFPDADPTIDYVWPVPRQS